MRQEMAALVKSSLLEDSWKHDVTTNNIVPTVTKGTAWITVQEDCIICGLEAIKLVYANLGKVQVKLLKKDGDVCKTGVRVAKLYGSVRNILIGERVALNILQRMSGVATITSEFVKKAGGVPIYDTRKTMPGLRVLDKYAVSVGKGNNHRPNLAGHVLIKSTHIMAAGGIDSCLERLFSGSPKRPIEIEVTSLNELKIALSYPVDMILLDNMSPSIAKKAIAIAKKKVQIEVSGGITLNNLASYAKLKPDRIAVGMITHSARAVAIHIECSF